MAASTCSSSGTAPPWEVTISWESMPPIELSHVRPAGGGRGRKRVFKKRVRCRPCQEGTAQGPHPCRPIHGRLSSPTHIMEATLETCPNPGTRLQPVNLSQTPDCVPHPLPVSDSHSFLPEMHMILKPGQRVSTTASQCSTVLPRHTSPAG